MIHFNIHWFFRGFLILAILVISPSISSGHHITRFDYTWMQVGKALVNGYRITLIVKPPELTFTSPNLPKRKDIGRAHEELLNFTHHFRVFVEDDRLKEPVPSLAVTLSVRGENGYKEEFLMEPRFAERGFHYGGNVRLDRRGAYELVVRLVPEKMALSALSKRSKEYFQKREKRFTFFYGYKGLKELMGDVQRGFMALASSLARLDLTVSPAESELLRVAVGRAKSLDRLADLVPTLRIGADQSKFFELSEGLKENTGKLLNALEKGRVKSAVRTLADVWKSCNLCHNRFRIGEVPRK